MRILATVLSALMIISFVNAVGKDLNKKPRRPWNVWMMSAPPRPDPGCPANPLQEDGTLPINRTLITASMFHVSRERPDQTFISNGWAAVTPRDKCTIFVFEIDARKAFGKTCNLVFDLPKEKYAPGLYRSFGPGQFTFQYFSPFAPPPGPNVTWNTLPPQAATPPAVIKELFPGTSKVIESAPCYFPLGIVDKVTRSGMLCSPHSYFQFKQGVTKCPLGLYTIITDPFKNN
ncbi:hypothetical protein yc1106_05538 [Curvularia clavata]|uniref:Ubiquitin 3 binding protein But2 C-terminal domain-containing protein n=1 Tax=Curvularia clavata TaxID=95742 RepID=A0A9Q9DTY3_CURCL|nr:hypothetical protein yc1106_05538 [Curvularia clavata]